MVGEEGEKEGEDCWGKVPTLGEEEWGGGRVVGKEVNKGKGGGL